MKIRATETFSLEVCCDSLYCQTVQSKQQSLLQRLDELDSENSDLRLQVADLEEANERFQDDVRRLNSERERLLKAASEKSEKIETKVNSVHIPLIN